MLMSILKGEFTYSGSDLTRGTRITRETNGTLMMVTKMQFRD